MQLKKGQIIELSIKKLAFGGKGIGEYQGRKVFVDSVVPGDTVQASFTRIKPKYAEAKLVEVTDPSSDRIKPRCAHFDTCGGCQIQFLPYEKQLEYKEQHVRDCFQRIGGIENPPVNTIIGAKEPFFYRNKMELSFGYDKEMDFAFGFHIPGRRFDIVDVHECHLQSPQAVKIINSTREIALKHHWQPRMYAENKGFLKNLVIRDGKRTGELMVNLITTPDFPAAFPDQLSEFTTQMQSLGATSIYWSQKIAQRGTPTRLEEKLLAGKKTLSETMRLQDGSELTFEILPQAFFQPNTHQAEILYSKIVELASIKHHQLIFDLFCGTGTIGLFLAQHSEHVLGIELNPDAIAAAVKNAQSNRIFNIDFYTGSTGKVLENINERPTLVVVDPPRAGLNPNLIKQISDYGTDELIYVSCNPATLARDAQELDQYGFKLQSAQPVDMFPHTYHIENVCLFQR